MVVLKASTTSFRGVGPVWLSEAQSEPRIFTVGGLEHWAVLEEGFGSLAVDMPGVERSRLSGI